MSLEAALAHHGSLGAMFSKPEIVLSHRRRESSFRGVLAPDTHHSNICICPSSITTVRLAVAKVLLDLAANAASLGNDWLNEDLLKLHFQISSSRSEKTSEWHLSTHLTSLSLSSGHFSDRDAG